MQKRPVIGVPTHTLQVLGGITTECPPSWVMSQRYVNTLAAAGALPWLVPLLTDEGTIREMYEELDGVFLPGGADIDPASFGGTRHPKTDARTDPPRDMVELAFVRWALADGKPVLGVCRGVQIINIACGGTLWQDVADERPGSIKHDYFPFGGQQWARDHLAHPVRVAAGSRLAESVGHGEVRVNSMHHQGIRDLGAGLVATAFAPDGLIEGAELAEGHFVVGVQWHPEVLTDGDVRMRRLFSAFIGAAADFRESREARGSVRRESLGREIRALSGAGA
jgi:putative glutamine amidotransferase